MILNTKFANVLCLKKKLSNTNMGKLSSPSKHQVATDANAGSTVGDNLADESISSVDNSYPSSYSVPGTY